MFITVFLPDVRGAKIGLFLGTFDPPHPGIAQMVAEAQNQLGLEMVYVLPTPSPVDRPEVAPVSHRLAMIRLMAQAIPGLVTLSEADLLLLSSRQPENVFAAMREDIMCRRSSEDEIYQIVGEDALPKLIAKKQLPEKNESRKLVVFPRHGILKLKHPAIDLLEKEGKLIRLATEIPDLASRELRKKLNSGQMPSHDELSKDIVNYILREGLYGVKRAELTRDEIDLLKIEGYSAKPVLLHSPTTDTIFVPAHLESYLSASELSGDHDQTAFPISILDLLRRFQIQVTIFQAPTTDSLDWLETQGWKTFFAFVPDQNLELPMYFFARRGEEWHLFITGLYAEQPCYDLVAKIYNFCAVNSISTDCLNILLPVSN
ncbi:MAG: nicotinate-nicotinamide nucleotide adenylyltransferase [Candidatus Rifleibacteriota bacterium]